MQLNGLEYLNDIKGVTEFQFNYSIILLPAVCQRAIVVRSSTE
jgi:hypothetical protein